MPIGGLRYWIFPKESDQMDYDNLRHDIRRVFLWFIGVTIVWIFGAQFNEVGQTWKLHC
jgi:hypothetical protein